MQFSNPQISSFVTMHAAPAAIAETKTKGKAKTTLTENQIARIREDFAKELSAIIAERKEWEQGVFRTANLALYEILTKCYRMEATLRRRDTLVRIRCKALDAFLTDAGFQLRQGTPVMSKIVRSVFGDISRNRLSVYVNALLAAKALDTPADKLVEFFDTNGGVEGVLRATPKRSGLSDSEKINTVKSLLPHSALATFRSAALTEYFARNELDEFVVLIASSEDDGSITINTAIKSGTALTAALLATYSEYAASIKRAAEEQKQADQQSSVAEARNAIVSDSYKQPQFA